jgi:hypothetical protein
MKHDTDSSRIDDPFRAAIAALTAAGLDPVPVAGWTTPTSAAA